MSEHIQPRPTARATQAWRRSLVVRHLLEMYLVMQIGMLLGSLLLAVALGTNIGEARRPNPTSSLLVMALGMTAPMVWWMLHRGHSRRRAGEMAAAMLAPALPLVGLQLGHVITTSGCGAYMAVSTVAMIALVVYRRSEYSMGKLRRMTS